jgi:hypothetical protein
VRILLISIRDTSRDLQHAVKSYMLDLGANIRVTLLTEQFRSILLKVEMLKLCCLCRRTCAASYKAFVYVVLFIAVFTF